MLALKDSLKFTPAQVTQIEAVSNALQEKLAKRRADLLPRVESLAQAAAGVTSPTPVPNGGRGEGGRGGQPWAMQVLQQLEPQLEASRKEVQDAMKQVEKVLGGDRWKQVPERIRNGSQQQMGRARLNEGG